MDEAVFRALANPTRRSILDLLSGGSMTTGALADAHPELSRYAVMQHLRVLADAGLVLVRREGRERHNHLSPIPLRQVYERWLGRIAGWSAQELLALRRHVERGDEMSEVRTVRVENELWFRASPQRVFAAMTTETLEWFPHTYGEDRVVGIVHEGRPGGVLMEDWGEGAGHLYGIIQQWDPPRSFTTRAWLGLGVTLDTRTEVEADGDDGAVLRQTKVAVGPLSDDDVKGIQAYGGLENFEDALREWIER